jgi:regulator of replication initiation timing
MLETEQLQNTTDLPIVTLPAEDLTIHHLSAMRDEWLSPVLMQLRHQSEQVGRLEMQVRQLRDERDSLNIELDQLRTQQDEHRDSESDVESEPEEFQLTLNSVIGLLSQLKTAEGAMVTGIAIAIGLWLGVGLVTFALLG